MEELLRSLKNPHPEAVELAETGLADWRASLPPEGEGLVDVSSGKPVRWLEGQGWVEEPIRIEAPSSLETRTEPAQRAGRA